jgi:hypothetical protein
MKGMKGMYVFKQKPFDLGVKNKKAKALLDFTLSP